MKRMETVTVHISKGDRIAYRFFKANIVSLAGAQMKTGATLFEGTGTVTHIYGNHPTKPTVVTLKVQPDSGEEEIEVPSEGVVGVLKSE